MKQVNWKLFLAILIVGAGSGCIIGGLLRFNGYKADVITPEPIAEYY